MSPAPSPPSWEHCYVITHWDGSETGRYPITTRQQALNVTQAKLGAGYLVAWSNALIERMTRRPPPAARTGGPDGI